MFLKNSIIISGIIVFLCTSSLVFANPDKTAAENYSEYAYTAQILRDDFGKSPAYIRSFLKFSKAVGMPLDPLFLGLKDSKPFTANQDGYTETQKIQGRSLLKKLVAQQFSKAKPSDNPTYTAFTGAPGVGKTFALQQEFAIDVAKGKFAVNAITIGPDLIVMSQIDSYQKARALPIGKDSAKAVFAAYSEDRDLSNAVANFMFMMAVTEHLNVVHDTTLTSLGVSKILDNLGKIGYQRIGRVYMADKVSRGGALDKRAVQNGGFASVTTKDALNKAVAAYERIVDGSYIGRFDDLSIWIQEPEFYLAIGTAVEVAKYDAKIGKIRILPGGQEHIDRIMQQVRDSEGLRPELLASLELVVNAWVRNSKR